MLKVNLARALHSGFICHWLNQQLKKKTNTTASLPQWNRDILVAEDEEEVRNLAKSLLEEAGYKVIAAVDGYDTINKFMEKKTISTFCYWT